MKTEVEWHYLPELPSKHCVLLAFKKFTFPSEGWFNTNTNQFGIYEDDSCEETTNEVYAWAYLPESPPIKGE